MRTCLFILCAAYIPLLAQTPKFTFEYISSRDGLPSSNIYWATEDEKGFLWLGTRRCLARYDGYEFKALNNTSAFSAVADSNLVFFTENIHQLKVLDVNNLRESSLIGEKEGGGHAVFLDTKGRIWLSDRDGIICYHPKTGKIKKHLLKKTSFVWHKGSVIESKTSEIWVLGMEVGLFKYDEQLDSLICKVGLDCPQNGFSSGAQLSHGSIDGDGVIWAGTTNNSIGLFQYDTKNEHFNHYVLPNNVGATAALADTIVGFGKVIWVGTTEGISLFNPQQQQFYFFDDIIPRTFRVNNIFKSRKTGIVWFSTSEGLIKFNPNNQVIQSYFLPTTLNLGDPQMSLYVICKDEFQKEVYWIGLSSGGLLKWNRLLNSITYFEYPAFPDFGETKWIIQDQHRLWIGVHQWQTWADGKADKTDNRFEGIFTFDTQQERFLPTPFRTHHQFFSVPFYSLGMIDDKNRFWIANHYEGIRVLDLRTYDTLQLWKPEAHVALMENGNWVMNLFQDSRERVWVATNQGLFYFDESKRIFQKIPDARDKNGEIPSNAFLKITEDLDGNIWVVGWHILWKLNKDGKQLGVWTELDGIYDSEIRNIAVDAWNKVWIGTFDGLHLFEESTNTFRRFTVNHGLISNYTLNGFSLADPYTLVIGNVGGWNVIDVHKLSTTKAETAIAISGVKVANQAFFADWNKPFVLKPKQNAISFSFSALNFQQINDTKYSYFLQGLEQDWREPTTTHEAVYTNLPPDDYIFKIRTIDDAGKPYGKELHIAFSVQPAYHQTLWFRGLVIAVLVLILYFAYKYRIRQILKIQAIRHRIAQDLHDDVGTNLTNIEILAHLSTKIPTDAIDYSGKIMQAARESNEALHQIVWSLKPENDQLEQIAIKLTSYAIEILEPLGIQLVVEMSSPLKDLRMNTEKRQDLFLVFKEIITNICKHAKADTVRISMEQRRNRVYLIVEDNGIGIRMENSTAGNGMKNMRQRIEKWKGIFEVSSSKKNQGTLIEIQLDIP